jgi:hypothetical protein
MTSGVGRDEVAPLAAGLLRAHGGRLGLVYPEVVRGFSAEMTPSAAAAIARHPRVVLVEPDIDGTGVGSQFDPPSWAWTESSHGRWQAGIIGGTAHGVAKLATLQTVSRQRLQQ